MSSEDRFGTAVRRLSDAFAIGRSDGSVARDHEIVRDGLATFLALRFQVLGIDEALDLVDESIARLAAESKARGEGFAQAPGWLSNVARNLAVDRLRRQRHESAPNGERLSDDALAALLDREASSGTVYAAARRAVAAHDHQCVRIVAEWLDLANETGEAPSSRVVGERTGYSHTTVNAALARFRTYLEEEPEGSS
jgi:DNA-directed RNA polymerase specialized sigma24 family protein